MISIKLLKHAAARRSTLCVHECPVLCVFYKGVTKGPCIQNRRGQNSMNHCSPMGSLDPPRREPM